LDKSIQDGAINLYADSIRHILAPLESYLVNLTSTQHKLRRGLDGFDRYKDIRLTISDCLAIISFVKKPISFQGIKSEIKDEGKIIEMILSGEQSEGRLSQVVSASDRAMKHCDIQSFDPVTKEERLIILETCINSNTYPELTEAQITKCTETGDNYWVYFVYDQEKIQKILKIQNPSLNMSYSGMETSTGDIRYVLRPRYQ
jgi:Domain of unknown function (DUF3883)